jgi:hypothetical protein
MQIARSFLRFATASGFKRMPAEACLNGMLIGVLRILFFALVVGLIILWARIARRGE